uniref:DUF3961 domain-containing protein n=1 Tax=Ascaris lumbricoides TaxID=6252 RepID=A0A0M3ITF0_ASCLU
MKLAIYFYTYLVNWQLTEMKNANEKEAEVFFDKELTSFNGLTSQQYRERKRLFHILIYSFAAFTASMLLLAVILTCSLATCFG